MMITEVMRMDVQFVRDRIPRLRLRKGISEYKIVMTSGTAAATSTVYPWARTRRR